MSDFITNKIFEEYKTQATMAELEKILKLNKYKIIKTKNYISANKSSIWSSNTSYITIEDLGQVRLCKNTQVSKGLCVKPKSGILLNIISKAEETQNE